MAANLLMEVTKSVIIHGFEFAESLEHVLKESSALGRHTNILHFTPFRVTKYLWAHKEYQPWGFKLPLQCEQCGILQPWKTCHLTRSYDIECKNDRCGRSTGSGRIKFTIDKPAIKGEIKVEKDSRWLKLAVN
jgi:hypothetical protein